MELLAILLTFVVHVIGAGVLVWALVDRDDADADAGAWRDWWPKDRGPEPPVEPGDAGGGRAEPPGLPDAEPSTVRLREPGRIGEHRPAPGRRPEHPPVPERPVRR